MDKKRKDNKHKEPPKGGLKSFSYTYVSQGGLYDNKPRDARRDR